MATCWYCEKRSADSTAVYKLEMHQHVPPYGSTTVSVPRCEECGTIHGRIQRLAKPILVVLFVVPTLLCLFLFLLRSVLAWRLPWGIVLAIAAVTGAVMLGIASLWEMRMLRAAETKGEGKALLAYPEVRKLKQDGWKHVEKVRTKRVTETQLPESKIIERTTTPTCNFCGDQVYDRKGGLSIVDSGSTDLFDRLSKASKRKFICPSCASVFCLECGNKKGKQLGTGSTHCPTCGVKVL